MQGTKLMLTDAEAKQFKDKLRETNITMRDFCKSMKFDYAHFTAWLYFGNYQHKSADYRKAIKTKLGV